MPRTIFEARPGVLLVALAAWLTSLSSCSLALDKDPDQCQTTQDCLAKGFTGLVCSDQHVCAKQGGCATNQECIDANSGAPYYCRQDNRTCIPLKTDICRPI